MTSLPSSINAAIDVLLPEGSHPDSALISSNIFVYFTEGSNNNLSVTFLQSVAAYTNRMGYAKYSNGAISNPLFAIQASDPMYGSGCIIIGDTWQFGPFLANDMVIFFLDSNSDPTHRYWSYFGPNISNPAADVAICGAPGCTHSAWAYLPDYDLTIFGFEDNYPGLGDADYNDLVFYLTLQGNGFYNAVPPYQNGTLLICNNATLVSWNSFTDVNCESWGLLESAGGASSCLTYMAIPSGWTWAPNDATSQSIILQSYKQWAYTGATTCYLLMQTPTTGVGWNVSASGQLQTCTASVKFITPAGQSILPSAVTSTTSLCYNTECTARYVLKSLAESVACASVPRCNTTLIGVSLQSSPSTFSSGVVTIPVSQTVYVATGSGSLDVTAQLQLTGTDLSTPKIDVAVLTDFYVDNTASGQGQRSYVDSSWSTVGASFRSVSLDTQFAVFNFVPNSNAATASYALTSSYTFASSAFSMPDAAYHTVSCGATAAATLQRGRNLVAAVNTIATSNAINWRSDSYHVVWIHSLCSLPSDGSSSAVSGSPTLQTIQQTTGLVPIIANGAVSTSTPTFASNAPWTYSWYYSGSSVTWDAPFRTYSYAPFRGSYLMTTLVKNFQVVASQGATSWLANIPTTPISASLIGYAAVSYSIAWPSSISSSTTTLYYAATVQIIGRGTISYLIYFNHPPTLASYSTSLSAAQASVTFTMTPSDPDQGNLLNLIIVVPPTKGILTLGATVANPSPSQATLTAGLALAVNVFTLQYTPLLRVADFTETIMIAVSDGCATSATNVTIVVPKVNVPPTAANVLVSMTEDQATSSTFNLASYMTDPDGNSVTAYLTAAAYVSSGNLRLGSLTTSTSTNAYVATTALPSGSLVYRLNLVNGLSGFGAIMIPYQAYDGVLYSATAYITINVTHVNHPPTISAVSTITSKIGTTATFSISVSDADYQYPGETAAIQVIASSWGSGSAAFSVDDFYGVTKFTYAGAAASTASPFAFSSVSSYSPGSNISVSGGTLTFAGFQWTTPTLGVTPSSQSFTIRAIDTAGAASSSAIVTLSLNNDNAPTWIQFPGQLPAQAQGHQWDGLYFSAYDLDGATEMSQFIFTVVSGPSNGVAYLEDASNNAFATALTTGYTFTPASSGLTTMVYYNTTAALTNFRIRYLGNPSYYGADTISFSVQDPVNGLSSSSFASATFTTTRTPTPPVSANFTINGYEQQWVQFTISAQSTNSLSLPVYIVLDSVQLIGTFYQFTGTSNATWASGTNSTMAATNGGSVTGYLQGALGFFSNPSTSPAGNFSYRVYEPQNNMLSSEYWSQIYLSHVNHPPTSSAQTSRIKKRQLLSLRLPASDPDADDTDSTLTAAIVSVLPYNGGPPLYFDVALTRPVNSSTITAGTLLANRTIYYVSESLYDDSVPLMTYQFVVYDQHGAGSSPYYGYIYVSPAGDLPIPETNETSTPQSTPVPMQLAAGSTTESGTTPTVAIASLPTKGTFSWCTDTGVCAAFTSSTSLPFTLPSSTGRVVYLPRDYDWGGDFTSFTYTLTDPGTGATGTNTMIIDVTHVNQAPSIFAANFLTTSQTSSGIIINESEWRNFDWYVNDVDDLPATLNTTVMATFYTSSGFSIYSCIYAVGSWNTTNCSFSSSNVPEAIRADFAKNAKVSVQNYEVVFSDCPDANDLKLRYGNTSRLCEAHFRFVFVPTPLASYTPYVTITWSAVDPEGASSTSISALISVKAVNQAPTIWAPAQVIGAQGITNPFIRDTNQVSATYNNPITVADVDSNGKTEQLTFQIVEGTGTFTFPASAPCAPAVVNSSNWVCLDTIASYNQWLTDVRFNVSTGSAATLLFVINDLGNSGDYKPSPYLSANATTTVTIGNAVAAPKGNSSTLAIAVGVAAGGGLLLLGALGFFLRNAVSPPAEDYFSAATAPLSSAPQSPLYQPQNTEHLSPIYKANT